MKQNSNSKNRGRFSKNQASAKAAQNALRQEKSTLVEDGPILPLTVERLSWGGDGIASHPDGRVVFVQNGWPGQEVEAQIIEDSKRFLRARKTQDLSTPFELENACPTAQTCGGCQFQGVPYAMELAWKVDALKEVLSRIAKDVNWPEVETIASPSEYGYRYRVHLRVDAKGQTGYMAKSSNDFVHAVHCNILHPMLEASRTWAGELAKGLPRVSSLRMEWDEVRRQVVVELPADTDTWKGLRAELKKRVELLPPPSLQWFDRDVSHAVTYRHRSRWEAILGDGLIQRDFGSALVEQKSGNFSQAHGALNHRMRERVAEWIAEGWDRRNGFQRVIDFYAGAGNLSFALAQKHARVVAIDHASEALEAGENAVRSPNARSVASWMAVDLNGELHGVLDGHFKDLNALVLDPPRGGLSRELLELVAFCSASTIVYVSCDPPAFARDVARLRKNGWRVQRVEAWDMFPRTSHLEVVARLYRPS